MPLVLALSSGNTWRRRALRSCALVLLVMATFLLHRRRRRVQEAVDDSAAISRRGLKRWSRRHRAHGSGDGKGDFVDLSHGRAHYLLRRPVGWREGNKKPTVVLFHGFGMFSLVYQDVAAVLLEHGHSVLAFDWYGHGYSDTPAAPLTVELMVQQARELIDRVLGKTSPITVIGHSMGGLLAAAYTAAAKERIAKLVLVCPAGSLAQNMSWRRTATLSVIHALATVVALPVVGKVILELNMRLMNMTSISTFGSYMKNGREKTGSLDAGSFQADKPLEREGSRNASRGILADMMSRLKTVSSDGEVRRGTAARFNAGAMLALGVTMHCAKSNSRFAGALSSILAEMNLFGDRTDIFKSAANAGVPTLLVWGDQDEYIPVECSDVLRKVMPSAQFTLFKGADHFVFLNRPIEFCSAVTRFLAHQELGKAMSAAALAKSDL